MTDQVDLSAVPPKYRLEANRMIDAAKNRASRWPQVVTFRLDDGSTVVIASIDPTPEPLRPAGVEDYLADGYPADPPLVRRA